MSYKVQEFLKIRDYQHNDNQQTAAEKIDKHDDLLVFFGFRVLDFVCVTRFGSGGSTGTSRIIATYSVPLLRCIFKFTNTTYSLNLSRFGISVCACLFVRKHLWSWMVHRSRVDAPLCIYWSMMVRPDLF
jgi:hypothetical protein